MHREMCPSKEVRKERGGRRAEVEAGRGTLPGVPKYLCGRACPQQGQRRAAPARLLRPPRAQSSPAPPPVSCLWQTQSVGMGTAGGGPRSSRWWLAAGVWGEAAWLGGPRRPFRPSVGAGCGCQAGLAWAVGDGGSSGRRRAAGSRPSAAGATETRSAQLLSS